jgi:ubiquinone/menaquinone biosynthesis C-methylase UbiE
MADRVCPWWLGYFLISPLRRLSQDPRSILLPFIHEGMTVLEPGCGMGFFTLDIARLVGPRGRIVAVDLQKKMLDGLRRRAKKAALADRLEIRQAPADTLGIDDLAGQIDFVLAFAVVHEFPDAGRFFTETHRALKPGGQLLLAEPQGHVHEEAFAATVATAERSGFRVASHPGIRRSRSVVLQRN